MLKTSDFYFDLPEELIAQTPLEKRDNSRLLTLNKETGETRHLHFYDLPQLLRPGDCLVLAGPTDRTSAARRRRLRGASSGGPG